MASRFHIPHALPRQKTCRERYTSFRKYCLLHTKVRNIFVLNKYSNNLNLFCAKIVIIRIVCIVF